MTERKEGRGKRRRERELRLSSPLRYLRKREGKKLEGGLPT